MLEATTKYLVARASWHLKFVYPCILHIDITYRVMA